MRIDPKEVSTSEMQRYMLGAVAPRPIAFVSSIDNEGNVNLSPYSNFNFFGANPPIMIFSASRRVRDNTTKHTLQNAEQVPEVVINIVNYPIAEQMSLSSTEYGKGVNEFIKSGLTEKPSEFVKPPRVLESPVSFECRVNDIISLGTEGGAGNLIICEVLLMHINDEILDQKNMIDPYRLDPVARLGGNWYARANGEVLFEIEKPLTELGIGFDQLPAQLFEMGFSKGELAKLANMEKLPEPNSDVNANVEEVIYEVKQFLGINQISEAWELLTHILK